MLLGEVVEVAGHPSNVRREPIRRIGIDGGAAHLAAGEIASIGRRDLSGIVVHDENTSREIQHICFGL